MKIGIINIDSKIPNIALEKIRLYHQNKNDEIVWNIPLSVHLMDKVYVSCVFTWNKRKAEHYKIYKNVSIGGTRYDINIILPDEIESLKPKINYGFTTRGCLRKCEFCFVPKKEGKLRIVGDIYDIWDGKSNELVLMDNNILGLPEHFKNICQQVQKHKLKLDFNQGLDIRLLTDETAYLLKKIHAKSQWRFSFDNIKYEKEFRKGADILKKAKISSSKICVYVLVGFNDTIDDALYRISVIYNEYGFDPFVMVYKGLNENESYPEANKLKSIVNVPIWKKLKMERDLARWCNHKAIFKSVKWDEYKKKKEDKIRSLF